MGQTDYDLLIEMGFDPERATLALKKTGGLQDALTWLEKNEETPIEQLKGSTDQLFDHGSSSVPTGNGGDDYDGDEKPEIPGTAASIKCSECGKLFSDSVRAEYHATRTQHTEFEESTEIIQPLTEEEKAAKLQELRERLAGKRAAQAQKDREETRKNELIRRKKGQESERIKEELKKKEQLKEVEKRKREKQEELAAKERVRQQIKETQEARRRQAEKERATREGKMVEEPAAAAPKPVAPRVATARSETRLQLRLPTSQPPLIKTFPAETTLFEVAQTVKEERGFDVSSFTTTFPRKVYQQGIDFGMTLKEVGMVPSCALLVN
ncbi:ubiquitin-related domain-containing protein [Tuber brumale]|nr:ubiquitin-related domain-containing protein [Tuber brumale]